MTIEDFKKFVKTRRLPATATPKFITCVTFFAISMQFCLNAQRNNQQLFPEENLASSESNTEEVHLFKLPMSADGIIRLSKIEVDPAYLDEYMKFATEVGEISLRTEPGVLTMYALQEKDNPCNITILETYASQEAYRSHIASAHFQKYKQETLHMVKNLILLDQSVMNPGNKIINFIE